MQRLLLIGLAGLFGTLGRYALAGAVSRRYGESFPWGTLVVNVSGCFLAGLVFQLASERELVGEAARTALLIGLLGGFTTFSSYGLQTFALARDGEFWLAALNVTASNLLGLLMVWAGYALARAF